VRDRRVVGAEAQADAATDVWQPASEPANATPVGGVGRASKNRTLVPPSAWLPVTVTCTTDVLTSTCAGPDVEPGNEPFPLNDAVTRCDPMPSAPPADVQRCGRGIAAASRRGAMLVAPSRNVTVPVGVPPTGDEMTVALSE